MTTRAALPTGQDKTARVREMFDAIAPRYDLVNHVMTFGLDQHWRRRTVRSLALAPGSTVLDVACGTGALGQVARRAGYHVVGVDMSDGMLRRSRGARPAALADAASLPFADGSFDGVLCGYALRNFTDLGESLREMGRIVRPGGRIAILEVATPPNPLVRAGHSIWFRRAVPLIGAVLSDADAYRYLPSSIAYLPPDAQVRQMLRDAGYAAVGRQLLQAGLSQILNGTRVGLPSGATCPP